MLKTSVFFNCLKKSGVGFFAGVPDSLLKSFCAYLVDHVSCKEHIIAANEGGAVALGAGYHLATGEIPLVYFQNSGLGNTVNPAVSLAAKEVYGIPMVFMIGWRGRPGVKDQPQHVLQGRMQNELLEVLDIPFSILNAQVPDIDAFLESLIEKVKERSAPVAMVVEPGTFEKYRLKARQDESCRLSREEAIAGVLDLSVKDDVIVSTTGKASRELYEIRKASGQGHQSDFLTVGSMGHASQIALGIALNTGKRVICLDGDGSLLMHMGSLAVTGSVKPDNFLHIVLNNFCHDSVGAQPTVSKGMNIPALAKACGYTFTEKASDKKELEKAFCEIPWKNGPSLIELFVKSGARSDLGRPDTTPVKNKELFMQFLKGRNER